MKRFKKDGTPTNQFQQFMKQKYRAYMNSTISNIYEVYKTPSQAKIDAMEYIKTRADSTPYIISYNAQNFTVAYFIYDESLDTTLFVVETKDNIYIISEEYI